MPVFEGEHHLTYEGHLTYGGYRKHCHRPAPPPLIDPTLDPRLHVWLGRLHAHGAQGWVFPSNDLKATWNLWHHGRVSDHIGPLRHLHKSDPKVASQVALWSKTKGVIRRLLR